AASRGGGVVVCRNCGGRRRGVRPVDDPRVVRRILTHLGVLGDSGPPPGPPTWQAACSPERRGERRARRALQPCPPPPSPPHRRPDTPGGVPSIRGRPNADGPVSGRSPLRVSGGPSPPSPPHR